MAAVVASLNWAVDDGLATRRTEAEQIKVAKLRQMKGRPITESEFRKMLQGCTAIVGQKLRHRGSICCGRCGNPACGSMS